MLFVGAFSSLTHVGPQCRAALWTTAARQSSPLSTLLASLGPAAHSSFVKSILKLLRHLPPATIEKSLCVAKLACSSLAAFTFLTFSSRALKKEKLFGMLFKSAHTQRSSLSSRTFFLIIRSRCERQKEKYKSVKESEANNGRHQTLAFTQECLRGCDASSFVRNARRPRWIAEVKMLHDHLSSVSPPPICSSAPPFIAPPLHPSCSFVN